MTPAVRGGFGIVAGLLVAFVTAAAVESLGHVAYPPASAPDFSNPEQLRRFMDALPLGALAFVFAAWFGGTFLGSLVAGTVGSTAPRLHAGMVGAVVLAATLATLLVIPHPTWFSIVALLGIIGAACGGGAVAARRARGQ